MQIQDEDKNPMKVLIVDDSLDLQRSLATLLAPVHGLRIVGYAQDVAGALELVTRLRPDLIVLDVALRGKSRGIDVLRRVVREHAHIQVLMLSNFTWHAMRRGLMDAGAHAYFDKGDEFIQARDWIAARAQAHMAGHRVSPA